MTPNETRWLMTAFMVRALNLAYKKNYAMENLQYETCSIVEGRKIVCAGNYDKITSWGCRLLNQHREKS